MEQQSTDYRVYSGTCEKIMEKIEKKKTSKKLKCKKKN